MSIIFTKYFCIVYLVKQLFLYTSLFLHYEDPFNIESRWKNLMSGSFLKKYISQKI